MYRIRPQIQIVWKEIAKRFDARKASGRVPNIVYIGPHSTVAELQAGGMYEYASLRKWSPRIVFIEPNPLVLDALREQLADLGLSKAEIVNAAVCEDDETEVPFYTLTAQYYIDHPEEVAKRHYKSKDIFVQNGETQPKEHAYSLDKQFMFDSVQGDDKKYLDQINVRCVAPGSLVTELGLAPEDVDILIVDAERYDVKIVSKFFLLKGFKPAVIQFEFIHFMHPEDMLKSLFDLVDSLPSKGFEVHQSTENFLALLKD